jgi:O-antigen/teichoic acid export membrane protein
VRNDHDGPAASGLRRLGLGLRVRGTQWMVAGAALAAIGAYLFQVVGTRALGNDGFAPVGTLWTIQYLLVSVVLLPIETHVARRSLISGATDLRASGLSLIQLWEWLTVVAVVASAVCWLVRDQLFRGTDDLALVVGAIVLAYGAFLIVRGRLAGTERFKAYGLVTASESMTRAVLAAFVAALVPSVRAFGWVMPLGALLAALWWVRLRRQPREPRQTQHGRVEPPHAARFLAVTTAANAITQALLAGGPLLLAFLNATPEEISIFFVTITAVRVPIVFAFGGLLSRLLPTFMRLEGSGSPGVREVSLKIGLGTLAVALPMGAVAAAVGGPLVALLFGEAFRPTWWLAAGATVGVLLATGSIIMQQLLIARGDEARGLVAWTAALAASAATVAIAAGSATARGVIGLLTGEGVALFALVLAASLPAATKPRRMGGRSQ